MPVKAPHELLVVGASAAGLFAATHLAKSGRRVTVCEASKQLHTTSRTLIVTSRLRDVLGELCEPAIKNVIRRYELIAGDRQVSLELGLPDLVVERTTIVESLAAHAKRAGVEIQFGRRFEGLSRDASGVDVSLRHTDDQTVERRQTDAVIGADGAYSRVAKAAGLKRSPLVPLVQALVALPADLPADTTRVWFVPEDSSFFYWLIPKSPTHGVLGLIADDPATARFRLDRFMARRGLQPLSYEGARIPEYRRWLPTGTGWGCGDVHIVGDAAGHVKVTTVGGLVTGLRGAIGVADGIIQGRESATLRHARRELDSHLLIRRSIQRFDSSDYSRLLDRLSPGVRALLFRHTRDEGKQLMLRLILGHPRLVAAGIRPLISSFFAAPTIAAAAGVGEEL